MYTRSITFIYCNYQVTKINKRLRLVRQSKHMNCLSYCLFWIDWTDTARATLEVKYVFIYSILYLYYLYVLYKHLDITMISHFWSVHCGVPCVTDLFYRQINSCWHRNAFCSHKKNTNELALCPWYLLHEQNYVCLLERVPAEVHSAFVHKKKHNVNILEYDIIIIIHLVFFAVRMCSL